MIKQHIKIAIRNLFKNKGYSIINIMGLAIGMAAVLLVAMWIKNQLQYDNFYPQQENIFKVWSSASDEGKVNVHDITSAPAAETLKKNYPEVKYAARMYWSSNDLFTYGDKKLKAQGNEADADFISIFDFQFLRGSVQSALQSPQSIVLTATLAKKLFGDEDPMEKTVLMNNNAPYKVTGVLQDLPSNSDFDFTYLTPLSKETIANSGTNWNTNTYYTFVQLQPGTDLEAFNKKIEPLVRTGEPSLTKSAIFLYPMSKMHLYTRFENGQPVGGKIEQIRLVAGLGIIILAIACINFMNLATARSQKRSKEVGLRKTVGAKKATLIQQFLVESILLAFIAGIVAIALAFLLLPLFNSILDKPILIDWLNPLIWISGVAVILFTGILAGIYPAFVLSSFNPIRSLKGASSKKQPFFSLREGLVVLQFGIAVVLIAATIVIRLQLKHAGEREVGYNTAQLIEIPIEGDLEKNYQATKSELLNSRFSTGVTRTGWTITRNASQASGNFSWEGATPEQIKNSAFVLTRAESDFVKTLNLTLVEGRDLDYANLPADSASVVINESAIRMMGLENPIGKYLKWGDESYTIVGVIKDYLSGSPYKDVQPMLMRASKNFLMNLIVRTNPNLSMKENLQGIEQVIKKFNPNYPFTYTFVDQQFALKFKDQEQTASLALSFSLLAIFISCLGLFGLASYIAETRVKEIGVRKVLGASVASIGILLSKDFIKLVLLSFLVAAPVAWWAANNWLNDFSYRIQVQWWMLALAGCIALFIAFLTVSSLAIRAARANPVNSLRNE
ncbi:ABC transporter permease [Sphingobacterium sp. MYb382]|uniref:ABC transporter permease n=1 Tax=Sphingobacterium sp. MYb382 TaxID=2745278 RepID=UPI0030B36162